MKPSWGFFDIARLLSKNLTIIEQKCCQKLREGPKEGPVWITMPSLIWSNFFPSIKPWLFQRFKYFEKSIYNGMSFLLKQGGMFFMGAIGMWIGIVFRVAGSALATQNFWHSRKWIHSMDSPNFLPYKKFICSWKKFLQLFERTKFSKQKNYLNLSEKRVSFWQKKKK